MGSNLPHLFDSPFDSSDPEPGTNKGTIPGVRENGGSTNRSASGKRMRGDYREIGLVVILNEFIV